MNEFRNSDLFHRRRLRLRNVKQLSHVHQTCNWLSQDLNLHLTLEALPYALLEATYILDGFSQCDNL